MRLPPDFSRTLECPPIEPVISIPCSIFQLFKLYLGLTLYSKYFIMSKKLD